MASPVLSMETPPSFYPVVLGASACPMSRKVDWAHGVEKARDYDASWMEYAPFVAPHKRQCRIIARLRLVSQRIKSHVGLSHAFGRPGWSKWGW